MVYGEGLNVGLGIGVEALFGEPLKWFPAKGVVKFRVARADKDAIQGKK
jgi:hypothetical protein